MTTRIALIGFGAIGRYVFEHLPDEVSVAGVVMRPERVADVAAELQDGPPVVSSIADLGPVDLVVEVAGHAGLAAHGVAALDAGHDLLVVSVGALADNDLRTRLIAAAAGGDAKLTILPGAVGGIDALSAAREGGLDRVVYYSIKPPAAWRGTRAEELVDLDGLDAPEILYSGPADEAARLYPKNANVAATIALAGAGFEDTEVYVIADPDAGGNIHRIEAFGAFGEMRVEMRGKPLPDNPKTSSLTAYSVLRALRNRAEAVEI